MVRKEFQKWLEQFPEDAEINVVVSAIPPIDAFEEHSFSKKIPFEGRKYEDYEFYEFKDSSMLILGILN